VVDDPGAAPQQPTVVDPPGAEPQPPAEVAAPVWTKSKTDWGGVNGGTANSSIIAITSWSTVYPLSVDLQSAHDQWLSQFPNISDPGREPSISTWDNYYPVYSYRYANWGASLGGGGSYTVAGKRISVSHTDTVTVTDFYPSLPIPSYVTAHDGWSPNADLGFGYAMIPATLTRSGGSIIIKAYWRETSSYYQTDGMKYALLAAIHDGIWAVAKPIYDAYQAAKVAADADLAAYQAYLARYNQYVANHAAWALLNAAYQAYLVDSASYTQRFADWQAAVAAYQAYLVVKGQYETALANWSTKNNAYQGYLTALSVYNAALAAWNASAAAYHQYELDVLAYNANHAAWVTNEAIFQAYQTAVAQYQAEHAAWAVNHGNYVAYQMALTDYQSTLAVWTAARNSWDLYQQKLSAFQTQAARYQQWLVQYQIEQAAYLTSYQSFLIQQTDYQNYLQAKSQWEATIAQLQPQIAIWKNYTLSRDGWIYLVNIDLGRADVNWPTGDAIFTAFDWWVTNVD
jgi:hypothetical protein